MLPRLKHQIRTVIIHGLTSFRRKVLLRLILRVTVSKQTAFHSGVEEWRGGLGSRHTVADPFGMSVPWIAYREPFPRPRSSNRTCGFPASGSPTKCLRPFRPQRLATHRSSQI